MLISSFCECCETSHWYDMCEVVDVVRFPELKGKLINGSLAPFTCAGCDSPIHLESVVSFLYWAEHWVALVVPRALGLSTQWMKKHAEFLLSESKPDRENLPRTLRIYGHLDYLLQIITASHHGGISHNRLNIQFYFLERRIEYSGNKVQLTY